jgi:hypothetical protein
MAAPAPSPRPRAARHQAPTRAAPARKRPPASSPVAARCPTAPRRERARPPHNGAGEARGPPGGADAAPGYHGGTCTERFSPLNPNAALVTISPTHPSVLSVCKPPPAPATGQVLSLSLVRFGSSSPAR